MTAALRVLVAAWAVALAARGGLAAAPHLPLHLPAHLQHLAGRDQGGGAAEYAYIPTPPLSAPGDGADGGPRRRSLDAEGGAAAASDLVFMDLQGLGLDLTLVLHRNTRVLAAAGLQVEVWDGSSSSVTHRPLRTRGGEGQHQCHFQGYVLGHSDWKVAASLCGHGVQAAVRINGEAYVVEPVVGASSASTTHLLYKARSIQPLHHSCAGAPEEASRGRGGAATDDDDAASARGSAEHRQRRAAPFAKTVELAVVADETMSAEYGAGLDDFVVASVNMVDAFFAETGWKYTFDVVLVKLVVFTSNPGDISISTDAVGTLSSFSAWQNANIFVGDDAVAGHYDHAALLTRLDLDGGRIGLANTAQICSATLSTQVTENGPGGLFQTANTMAHELGHSLSLSHDVGTCFVANTTLLGIMSATTGNGLDPWEWSNCSEVEVEAFFDASDPGCLDDAAAAPPDASVPSTDRLPGEYFDVFQQCGLQRAGSRPCSSSLNANDVCRTLQCAFFDVAQQGVFCEDAFAEWLDGTRCGLDAQGAIDPAIPRWCLRGECVDIVRSNATVDGGFSAFGPFGACSLSCGGGVRIATRTCTNPTPSFGGSPCVGDSFVFEPCNTQFCPQDQPGIREQQCLDANAAFDPFVNGPSSGNLDDDCAQLRCVEPSNPPDGFVRTVFNATDGLPIEVIDGTPCGTPAGAFAGKCLQGRCVNASCDNVILGNASLANCTDTPGEWSAFGPFGACSKDCDTGVRRRVRFCSDPVAGCLGSSVEFEACNTANCSCVLGANCSDTSVVYEPREDQCQGLDTAQATYVPALSSTVETCALRCRRTFGSQVASFTFADIDVAGGARCRESCSDVCLEGVCIPSQCFEQGVFEPTAALDACGVCNGGERTCTTTPNPVTSRNITGNEAAQVFISVPPLPAGRKFVARQTAGDSLFFLLAFGNVPTTLFPAPQFIEFEETITNGNDIITYSGRQSCDPMETVVIFGPTTQTYHFFILNAIVGNTLLAEPIFETHISKPCLTSCPAGQGLIGECTFGQVPDDFFRPTCDVCIDGSTFSATVDGNECGPCSVGCPAGQQNGTACVPAADRVCVTCPATTFKLAESVDDCAPCTADCPPGSELTGACQPLNNPTCEPCQIGSFKNTSSADACQTCSGCPVRTFESDPCTNAGRPDDVGCSDCEAGCLACTDATECTLCEVGKLLEAGDCVDQCSDGLFGIVATRQCQPCDPSCPTCSGPNTDDCLSCDLTTCTFGKEFTGTCSAVESTSCVDCQPGFFKDDQANTACTPCKSACPPGEFFTPGECTATVDLSTCTVCGSGSFKAAADASACLPCTTLCPAGQTRTSECNATADTVCEACPADEFKDATGFQPCQPCLASCAPGTGVFLSCRADRNAQCSPCTTGFTQTDTALLACRQCLNTCPAGSALANECNATNDDFCVGCASGTFKAQAGGAACAPCTTTCGPGTFLTGSCTSTVTPTCEQCAAETFKANIGPEVCTPCTAVCPAGQELAGTCNQISDRSCAPCGADTFKAAAGGAACQACTATCPAGKTIFGDCTATTDKSCVDCPSRFFKATVAPTGCAPCKEGCQASEYLAASCTLSSNTLCIGCSVCGGNTLQARACSNLTNTACIPFADLTTAIVTFPGAIAASFAADPAFPASAKTDIARQLSVSEDRIINLTVTRALSVNGLGVELDQLYVLFAILPPTLEWDGRASQRATMTLFPLLTVLWTAGAEDHFKATVAAFIGDTRLRARRSTLASDVTVNAVSFPGGDTAVDYTVVVNETKQATLAARMAALPGDAAFLAGLNANGDLSGVTSLVQTTPVADGLGEQTVAQTFAQLQALATTLTVTHTSATITSSSVEEVDLNPSTDGGSKNDDIVLIIGAVIGAIAALALCAVCLCCLARRRRDGQLEYEDRIGASTKGVFKHPNMRMGRPSTSKPMRPADVPHRHSKMSMKVTPAFGTPMSPYNTKSFPGEENYVTIGNGQAASAASVPVSEDRYLPRRSSAATVAPASRQSSRASMSGSRRPSGDLESGEQYQPRQVGKGFLVPQGSQGSLHYYPA